MADDTAALVVALSAQLSKFEKDMKGAVDIADKRTKEIESSFVKLNKGIENQLTSFANNATAQLGPIGSIMAGLGPIGLTIAASLGTLALAFAFVSDKVDQFVEKAKRIKEASDTAGITITQMRLLATAGGKVGLDFEQTEKFITQLTLALDNLRTNGSGPLFDALLRINSDLVRQVASTKDTATAVDILARAYAGLTDQVQRNQLIGAIAGRRNVAAGRALELVAIQGGLAGMEQAAEAAGTKIDTALTERIVKLRREIDEIKKRTDNMWGATFSEEVLQQQKRSAEFWERITKAIVGSREAGSGGVGGPQDFMLPPSFQQGTGGGTSTAPQITVTPPSQQVTVPLPRPRPDIEQAVPKATQLALMREWISLLGEAITPQEALKLKTLELDAAIEKGGKSEQDRIKLLQTRARALDAFVQAQSRALLGVRESLGVATEQQIVEVKLAQLERDRIKFKLQDAEVEKARVIILREAKEAADRLTVRQAYLPGLKQLELDAGNMRKQLDTLAVNSLNNLSDALVDVVSRTKSASDAFRAMANAIIRDLARIIIQQALLRPVAGLFGLPFAGRAVGGPVAAGTPYVVGERGPEVFVPDTPGRIVPNAPVAPRGGSGGGSAAPSIVYAPQIDARGADAAAVARLEVAMAKSQREFDTKVKSVVNTWRSSASAGF